MRYVIPLNDTWNKTLSMNIMIFRYSQNHFYSPYGQSTIFKFRKLISQNSCFTIFRQFYQTSNFKIVYAYARANHCRMISTYDTVYVMVFMCRFKCFLFFYSQELSCLRIFGRVNMESRNNILYLFILNTYRKMSYY